MMTGRRLSAMLLAVAALLAACGSDGESTDTEEAGETGGEPVTITFWDNQQTDSGLSEYQQTAVDEFAAEHPNITVEIETVPYAEYQQRLQLAIEGGDPPDVATVDQIWMAAFAEGGSVTALDDYVAGSDSVSQDAFFSGAWDSAVWDGQLWGIPFNVDVWQFTYYNRALLDEAGIDPEQLTTWEGLRDAGEALTTDGTFGIGLFGTAYESLVTVMDSFIFSNGGSVLAEDGSCALAEPAATEALAYLASLQEYAPSGILNTANEDIRELFLNGAVATEWWPALEQPTLQDSDLDWGFVAGTAPEGQEPVGTYGGWNLVIFEDSENADAAWEFIEFLTGPEVNQRVVDLIPANTQAAEAFLADNREDPETIMSHLENARPRPLSPDYLEVSRIQQQMMQEIFEGADVEQAAQDACAEIDALG